MPSSRAFGKGRLVTSQSPLKGHKSNALNRLKKKHRISILTWRWSYGEQPALRKVSGL